MNAVNDIIKQRSQSHGDYRYVSKMSQDLKNTLKSSSFYNDLDFYMAEALDMICMKEARILAGNARMRDHWLDIAGYAMLVVNELERSDREMHMDRVMETARVEEGHDQQPAE